MRVKGMQYPSFEENSATPYSQKGSLGFVPIYFCKSRKYLMRDVYERYKKTWLCSKIT